MGTQQERHRILGLPVDAQPEDMERRCEALLEWLDSDAIPEDLRGWASEQVAVVQRIYVSLATSETPERAQPADAGSPADAGPRGTKEDAAEAGPSFLGWLLGSWVPLSVMGVFLGLMATGLLWMLDVLPPGDDGGSDPAAAAAADFTRLAEARQERIDQLEDIVVSDPANVDALFELAETHMTGGDWQEAIDWFTTLLEREPTNLHARTDVGTAHMNLERYAEAKAAFDQVLDIDSDNVQAHYNMGFLSAFRTDQPELEAAVEHWQEVVRLAPESNLAEIARVHIDQLQSSVAATGKE